MELKTFIRKNFKRDVDGVIPFLVDEIILKDFYAIGAFRNKVKKEIKTIFDFGANIGVFSIYAHLLFPTARIIAVEGNPEIAELLKYNLGLIDGFSNYAIDVLLIHKDVRRVSLGVIYDKPGIASSSICIKANDDASGKFLTVPFDKYIDSIEYDEPYIFKFDIEGGEEGIFASSKGEDFIRKSEMTTFELHFGKKFGGISKDYYFKKLELFNDTHNLNILYTGKMIVMGNLVKKEYGCL